MTLRENGFSVRRERTYVRVLKNMASQIERRDELCNYAHNSASLSAAFVDFCEYSFKLLTFLFGTKNYLNENSKALQKLQKHRQSI